MKASAVVLSLLSIVGIVVLLFGVWGAILSIAYHDSDFFPFCWIAMAGMLLAVVFGILAVRVWGGQMLLDTERSSL